MTSNMNPRLIKRPFPSLRRESAFYKNNTEEELRLEDLEETEIVPTEVFRSLSDEFPSRIPLVAHIEERHRYCVTNTRRRKRALIIRIDSDQGTGSDSSMDDATQPATQPYQDPRRLGRNNSGLVDDELADVLCILHPTSEAACEAVKLIAELAPQHVAPNDDLIGDSDVSFSFHNDSSSNLSRDIALRFSSPLKHREMGFTFGRNNKFCDVPLVREEGEKQLSNIHFRVFLNADGTLMLQDTSTNGTCVDGIRLMCAKGMKVHDTPRFGDTRMLHQGALIQVVGGRKNEEIKFMVRLPPRGEYNQAYLDNAERWIAAVNGQKSKLTALSSTSENLYGMHWNGGDEYNVTGNIGKGAFATVYKIATKKDGRVFAAKELDKRRFMKNGILDLKVENEMRIMKNLRHPNIVKYAGYHEHDQWVYIIMEFVPCGELSGFVSRHGPLTEPNGQFVTRQVLHALDYLHKRNITHRDIKPDNLLIYNPNPLKVKLSDFGLSKCVNDQDTFLKTFCGTLLYCAPEVYPEYGAYLLTEAKKRRRRQAPSKTSPYDQSVDMWSFGAVLFHILSGTPPIIGRGDDKGAQMLNNIMTKPINDEPLSQQGISREGIRFILKLLQRDPVKRPKEKECFNDPWLVDVADQDDYEKYDEEDPPTFDDQLQAIPEDPPQEAANSDDRPYGEDEYADKTNLLYASKRQRVDSPMSDISHTPEIAYPLLPAATPDDHAAARGGGRLFGEISRNDFPSSDVFGDTEKSPDVPAVTQAVENVSVNDFVTFSPEDFLGSRDNISPATNRLLVPPFAGSAPSLMGAEAQLGQFQMASPKDPSDSTSPSSTNPQTPKTRELTPSESEHLAPTERYVSQEQLATSGINTEDRAEEVNPLPKRRLTRSVDIPNPEGIDVSPPPLPPSYHANIGPKAPLRKAATFHFHQDLSVETSSKLARTTIPPNDMNAVSRQRRPTNDIARRVELPEPAEIINPKVDGIFVKPAPRLGKLKSMLDSFTDVTINLNNRMTSWGRASSNSVIYPDSADTRVPKCGLQITFWAPGIEEKVENGVDWMKVAGIRTVVSTQTSTQIWVNGVKLRRESTDGEAGYLFGKIYTGDVVTIREGAPGQFLKFLVEIYYGDSARYRPPEEPFKIRKETRFYSRGKSMIEHQGNEISPVSAN